MPVEKGYDGTHCQGGDDCADSDALQAVEKEQRGKEGNGNQSYIETDFHLSEFSA